MASPIEVTGSDSAPDWQPIALLRRARSAAQVRLGNMTARVNQTPIFVLGNQKSGTSAIAALLGAATSLLEERDRL